MLLGGAGSSKNRLILVESGLDVCTMEPQFVTMLGIAHGTTGGGYASISEMEFGRDEARTPDSAVPASTAGGVG